jgi:hypothetical protein
LNSIEKIKIKRIRNSKEKGKIISAQPRPVGPTRPSPACPRACQPVLACPRTLSLSTQWGQPIGVISPHVRAPLSLSTPRARPVSAEPFPPRACPCLCAVGLACQLRLPHEPPLTSTHARREPRPRRLPTPPAPFRAPPAPALSLPCLILPTLALSRALPPPPLLAGRKVPAMPTVQSARRRRALPSVVPR